MPNSGFAFDLQMARELFELGGPVVAILIVLSIVALAIIVRKLIQLLPLNGSRQAAAATAVRTWRQGNRREALVSLAHVKGPTAEVVASAMEFSLRRLSPSVVREEIERLAGDELHALRSHLRGIEAIAQISPLLGLFGTILGMIEAFRVLQAAGAQVDPAMLAGGIWVALLTTAVGLAVAMPCNMALYWFEGRIERERQAIESLATAVVTSAEDAGGEPASSAMIPLPVPKAVHAH